MAQKKNDKIPGQTRSLPFFHSMRGTLIIWFLALALIPVAVVGVISYVRTQRDLLTDAKGKLVAVNSLKRNEIARRFLRWETDVKDVASNPALPGDIGDLSAGLKYLDADRVRSLYFGKNTLEDAGDGSAYSAVHREKQLFFSTYTHNNRFEDVFLIDTEGNVVYSTLKTDVFGTNLASGPYRESNLGVLYRELRKAPAEQVRIADASRFGETVAMFMGAPVYQEDTPMGILVIQLPLKKINAIMLEREGMGKTGETYLVGPDRRMRSDSFLDPKGHSVEASFAGDIDRNGVDTVAVRNALAGKTGVDILAEYRGEEALSAYAPLEVLNLNWAVISEIDIDEAFAPVISLQRIIIFLVSVTGIFVIILAMLVTRRMVLPLTKLTAMSQQIAAGNLVYEDISVPRNEIGLLKESFKEAVTSLQEAESERERNTWLGNGQAQLEEQMRGDQEIEELCRNIVTFIANYIEVQIGTLYVNDGEGLLKLKASYAYQSRKGLSNRFKIGEGLIGQAALEKQSIMITDVPDDYITVTSGLGKKKPKNISVVPLIYNDLVTGVLEIGSFREFSELQITLVKEAAKGIAIAINSAQSRVQLQKAFEMTQRQAEELQAQQEELKTANEELEEQTQKLRGSEEELKAQQEELQVTNEELEEKTHSLEEQSEKVTRKNEDLKVIQKDLEQKATELEISSRYKSEFLANMSHELRTPLNSLLILSQDMAQNKKKNLDADQIESATIIHKSGEDLVNLINDILDLSKIEAGRMDMNIEEASFSEIGDSMTAKFKHIAEKAGLGLAVDLSKELPDTIQTDRQRLEQILSNLMSNAIKFTEEGKVTMDFQRPGPDANLSRSGIDPGKAVAISVTDTGIGITKAKQLEVFEAFQQADGSTSRLYGGTGLGLAISRELARLLGGEIQLESVEGKGSTFTVFLPEEGVKREGVSKIPSSAGKREGVKRESRIVDHASRITHHESIPDDRDDMGEDERVILVIEDDLGFAKTLYRFCHERNLKCIHAGDGETGLKMAGTYGPDAIILDIRLPGLEGWGVLDALKRDTRTRHIPVHMMSVEEESIDAYKKGAIGYLTKPVTHHQLEQAFVKIGDMIERNIKNLLIVEDDKVLRENIVKLIGNGDVKIKAVGSGREAIEELKSNAYDCMILDLKLPDISGFEVLNRLDESEEIPIPPVIVYTGRDLTREEEYQLQKYASSIIVKGVKSQERLLDETALFLHRVVDNLPATKRKMISALHDEDTVFQGKKILVADDDMRNVFAISKILEEKGMDVHKAADGQKALDILNKKPDMDLVLMDIMMPVMDGYEAIRKIRAQECFRSLPILAVTAKAMREDRDKCISAGANDYLPKPVEIERLLSLMRVWLYSR